MKTVLIPTQQVKTKNTRQCKVMQRSLAHHRVVPFELGGQVLGQGLGEALPSDAVVGVCAEDPEHSPVDLQRRHAQGRPAQLIHQDVAVETRRGDVSVTSACHNGSDGEVNAAVRRTASRAGTRQHE